MRGKWALTIGRAARLMAALAIALHVSLPAWHQLSHTLSESSDRQLLAPLQVICHGSGAPSRNGSGPADNPPSPAIPKSDCLICKGLADVYLALPSRDHSEPLQYVSIHPTPPVSDDAVAGSDVKAPRNRGPPLIA
jgi:hypothetical protein